MFKDLFRGNNLVVFFIGSSVFSFLMLASPITATILAGANLEVLHAAPIIATALGSFAVFKFKNFFKRLPAISLLIFLCLISIPISLVLFKLIQLHIDTLIIALNPKSDMTYLKNLIPEINFNYRFWLMLAISFPFFSYGAFIAANFESLRSQFGVRFYAAELLGVLNGFLSATLLLDYVGFKWVLVFIFLTGAAGAYFAKNTLSRIASGVLFLVGILAFFQPDVFEPQRKLEWLLRDFTGTRKAIETKKSWTSFTKVQLLDVVGFPGLGHQKIVIGEGLGHVQVNTTKFEKNAKNGYRVPEIITAAVKPKSVLVLFAGAGADMIMLQDLLDYPVRIVGVELNKEVVSLGMAATNSRLPKFLEENKDRVQLITTDARRYLQTTDETFDVILFAWSGASFAQYSGAILHTADFAFTFESFNKAYDRLNENGYFVLLGGPATRNLIAVKKLFKDRGRNLLSDSTMLILNNSPFRTEPDSIHHFSILVKKGTISASEAKQVEDFIIPYNLKVGLGPNGTSSAEYDLAKKFLSTNDELESQKLAAQLQWPVGIISADDNPFVYHPQNYFDFGVTEIFNRYLEQVRASGFFSDRMSFVLLLVLFLFYLLFLESRKKADSKSFAIFTAASVLLGAFSGGFFVLIVYKSLLFLGNPSHAILFTQSASLITSALATYLVSRNFSRLSFSMRNMSVVYLLLCGFSLLLINSSLNDFFYTNFGLFIFFLSVATLYFFGSWLFAKMLEQASFDSQTSGPAVFYTANLLGSGVSSVFMPLLAENLGFSTAYQLIFISAALFAVIVLTARSLFRTYS